MNHRPADRSLPPVVAAVGSKPSLANLTFLPPFTTIVLPVLAKSKIG